MSESKKIGFLCFFVALSFIFTLTLFSCTTQEEKDWIEIKENGTLEDLLEFTVNSQNEKFIAEANKSIQKKINEEKDVKKLISLTDKYPEKENAFKYRISEITLNIALEENTPEALEEYIADFTDYGDNSTHISQAEETLKNLYFNTAKEQKSLELLDEFVNRYSNSDSVLTDEALKLMRDTTEKNEWNNVLEQFTSENNLLPLIKFVENNPDSAYIPDALLKIEQMQNDSSYSSKYISEPTLDLIDEFTANFPGHKDINKALKLRENFTGDIYSMIEKEQIVARVAGDSITRCRITVENHTESRLEITIPLGVYLTAYSINSDVERLGGSTQNMLVTKEMKFKINPGKYASKYIDTACMNIYKDVPGDTVYFNINMLEEDSQLFKLLKVIEENESSYEVTQAAVWYITDNPGKDVILAALEYEDENGERAQAISEEDYIEALRLVELSEK